MASTKDYLDYVLDLLREVPGVHYRKMMGEYLLYRDNVLFGGVYDDRFLVKDSVALEEYGFRKQIPYPGAKPMLLVDLEDAGEMKNLVKKLITGK